MNPPRQAAQQHLPATQDSLLPAAITRSKNSVVNTRSDFIPRDFTPLYNCHYITELVCVPQR